MFLRITQFEVLPSDVAQFVPMTVDHAVSSLEEEGVERFEFFRGERPHTFVILIQFRDEQARASHFETQHFQQWNGAIERMLAKPREGSAWFPIVPG